MDTKSRIFRVDPVSKKAEELQSTTFSDAGFLETTDIHEWLAGDAGMLGVNLLVIQREHVGVVGSGRRPDILAIDTEGNLVVIEAKRDDSGIDVYWQAIRYAASYWLRSANDLIEMYANYAEVEREEALRKLLEHTESEDELVLLAKLNKRQRIVLASRAFPKEVTTAVLWLREQHGVDISCLQITPHYDQKLTTHYVQATYIIPVPETKDLMVELRKTQQERTAAEESNMGGRRNDDVTRFMLNVREELKAKLTQESMPTHASRWAGKWGTSRPFKLWYDEQPWANYNFCFAADLETAESNANAGKVHAYFYVYVTYVTTHGVSKEQTAQLKDLCRSYDGKNGHVYNERAASFYVGKWVPGDHLSAKGARDVAGELAWLVKELAQPIKAIVETLKESAIVSDSIKSDIR